MVLEEEVYFATHDLARDFTKLMKELGVSTQIRQKASLDIRLMLSGTYTNLTAMLDEIATGADLDEDDEEICRDNQRNLTEQRDLLASAFEKYQIGDRVGSSLLDIATGDRTLNGDESDETLESIIEEIYLTRLLHLNDLLEIGEAEITLAKKIEPDQAIVSIFADEVPSVEGEILKKYEVSSTITAGDDEEWLVTLGPELIFLEDLSRMEEFFQENEMDDDDSVALFTRMDIKQILVSEILSMIRKQGNASREEIIEEFSERDVETKGDGSNVALHLSRSYIDGVLDDLKKTGILKGKDQKMRLSA